MVRIFPTSVFLFVLVSSSLGCGGPAESTTGGGGTGGSGGTGASGGTGGASGGDTTVCARGCDVAGGTCVEDKCLFSEKTLQVDVVEATVDVGGDVLVSNYATVSLVPAGKSYAPSTLLASDGPCVAVIAGEGLIIPVFDAGAVTVQGPNVPNNTVVGPPGYFQDFDGDIFAPGDTIAITAAGGPDFPAFTGEAVAPEELDLVVGPINPSEPLAISWTPEAPPTFVFVTTGTNGKAIYCTPESGSSLEVPASLVSQLDPPGSDTPYAWALRAASVSADTGAPDAKAVLGVTKYRQVDTTYEP